MVTVWCEQQQQQENGQEEGKKNAVVVAARCFLLVGLLNDSETMAKLTRTNPEMASDGQHNSKLSN